MTDKELKKLHKNELLELCLNLRRELDKALQDNGELSHKLERAQENRALLEEVLSTVKEKNRGKHGS